MLQLHKYPLTCLLSILMLSFSTTSSAVSCNERSPNLKNEEDYYNLDKKVEIEAKVEKKIRKFLNKLNGDKVGKLSTFECIGSEKNPREKITDLNIAAQLKVTSTGILKINYESFNPETKITKLKKFNTGGIESIYTLKFKKDNTLIFSEKYRKAIRSQSTTALSENIYIIKKKNKNISIEMTSYRNGFFAFNETWHLKAD